MVKAGVVKPDVDVQEILYAAVRRQGRRPRPAPEVSVGWGRLQMSGRNGLRSRAPASPSRRSGSQPTMTAPSPPERRTLRRGARVLRRVASQSHRAARPRRLRDRRHARRRRRDREIAPAGRVRLRRARREVALSGRDRAAAVRRRPHPSRQGRTSGGARPIRPAISPGALAAGGRRPRGATGAPRDVAARMEFSLRAAYAHGTRRDPHPYRQRRPADAHHLAGLRRGARALARAGSNCSGAALQRRVRARPRAYGRHRGDARRPWHRESSARSPTWSRACARAWTFCSRSPSARAGISISMSTRPPIPAARSLDDRSPRWRSSAALPAASSSAIAARSSRQEDDERARTIETVARAGISVVSLPMCNMFLQDRPPGRTPRWRGVTALHELKAAGVNVMIASDNTRDPFYALRRSRHARGLARGRADPASRLSLRRLGAGGRAPRPPGRWASNSAFSARAARADMILTRARDFTELFARPHADRVVVRERRSRRPRRRPTMPSSTPWRDSRHEPRL